MSERGHYGNDLRWRGRALVGVTLFHGISDRDTAAQQIDTQLRTIASVVLTAAGADPSLVTHGVDATATKFKRPDIMSKIAESRDAINKSPYAALWYDGVSPLLNEWTSFYDDRRHWYDAVTEVFTSWEDYTRWFQRVADIRKKVEDAGIRIALPPMLALHKSAQEVAEGAASDIWTAVKYGIYGMLAIGGVVAVSSVMRNLRSTS